MTMGSIVRCVFVAALAFTGSTGHAQSESVTKPLSKRVFELMYAPVAGDWLPQVFVFDRAGTCVGVISKPDPQTVAALALAALDKRTKACDLTVSDEFPGESAGNRTAIVQMIGLGGEAEAFCQNCTTVRNALDKALQERKDVRLDVLAVDLSKTDSEP